MTLYTATDLAGWNAQFTTGSTIKKIGPDVDNLVIVDWVANSGVYTWDTFVGDVLIYENGNIDPPKYNDTGSTQGHPSHGVDYSNGEIYLTRVKNGVESSPIRLQVSLHGNLVSPPGDTAPTAITPSSVTISEGTPTGQVFATVTANQPNCTFSEVLDASNKFSISAAGAIQLTASITEAGSPYSFTVRATNGGGTFDQIVTINATAIPSGGSLVGDVDASTASAVTSTLSSWASNWAGTVPGGKTAADRRFIRITAPIANLDLTGYDFSAVAGVTIFAAGPYTVDSTWPYLPSTGGNITTQLKLHNCRNIRLTRMRIRDPRFQTRSYNCEIDRCVLHGDWTTYGAMPTLLGREMVNTDTSFHDNYWWGFKDFTTRFQGTTNCIFDNSLVEYTSGDGLKASNSTSTETNLKVRRNWLGREYGLGPTSHADAFQMHFGVINGGEIWGNVFFRKYTPFGNQQTSGCFFISNGEVTNNLTIQNNIICMNNRNAVDFGAGSGNTSYNNTLIRLNNGPVGSVQQAWCPISKGTPTMDYNYVTVESAGIAGGEGANGIKTTIGSCDGAIPSWANHLVYFDLEPTDTGDIRNLKPKSGTATHWAFGGTKVGAWERSKEIWADGLVPGNVGWPVAEVWTRLYDPTRSITTTYTGNYDGDGDNV